MNLGSDNTLVAAPDAHWEPGLVLPDQPPDEKECSLYNSREILIRNIKHLLLYFHVPWIGICTVWSYLHSTRTYLSP